MNLTLHPRKPIKTFLEGDKFNDLRKYEEMYLRWLQTRRDFPWLNEPAPALSLPFTKEYGRIIREQLEREFNR